MPNIRAPNGIYSRHAVNRLSCQQQLYMCIFFFLLVSGRCLAEHCHQNELQACMEHVKPIMQNVTIGFAANADQLNTVCRLFNQGMECIERFVSRCFQESQRILFRENMAGVEEVMKKLCTDGEYRKEYLTHADCFRSIAPQYEECGGTFRTSVGHINQNRAQDTQDKLAQMCGALHRFLECAYSLTRSCGSNGQRAAEFLRQYTEKAVGSLIASTCRKQHAQSPSSRNNEVIEIDEADGLREVNIQEEPSTPIIHTTLKPMKSSRKGSKKERGRSRSTTTIASLLSTLPSTGKISGQPETARSHKKADQKSTAPCKTHLALLPLFVMLSGFLNNLSINRN